MTGPLYSLSRKEGWRRYIEAPARQRPEQLQPGELGRLGEAAREEYDEARHDWHANFGIMRTPQLAAVHDELDLIVSAGRQDPDRVRGAAVIDALPGQGRQHWAGLLKATERQFVLARAHPGMLTGLADYLFERTSGHIGSYITLITRGCFQAIRGGEMLTAALLDSVRIDEASEQARRQLAAAFTAGRLSAKPAARRKPRAAAS